MITVKYKHNSGVFLKYEESLTIKFRDDVEI